MTLQEFASVYEYHGTNIRSAPLNPFQVSLQWIKWDASWIDVVCFQIKGMIFLD